MPDTPTFPERDANNRQKGSEKEAIAASFLLRKKYEILEKNYRQKSGEIDLIAKDPEDGAIVFVEVKYRRKTEKGFPEEAVTRYKQQRIYRTAEWYLLTRKLPVFTRCRFDVVSILGEEIRHIKNAFGGF